MLPHEPPPSREASFCFLIFLVLFAPDQSYLILSAFHGAWWQAGRIAVHDSTSCWVFTGQCASFRQGRVIFFNALLCHTPALVGWPNHISIKVYWPNAFVDQPDILLGFWCALPCNVVVSPSTKQDTAYAIPT